MFIAQNSMEPGYSREEFPFFSHNRDIIYADNAATTLKPAVVMKAIEHYYQHVSANVFRGLCGPGEQASIAFEDSRETVANFLNAKTANEVIFTRNTTESINLLAYTLSERFEAGDEIAVTALEHHANFLPWQQLAKRKNLSFRIIPPEPNGSITPELLRNSINQKTKLFACTHASNVTGAILPITELIREAKSINPNILTVVDAAQAIPHIYVRVNDIDCDFLAFSSHKLYGPTGVGVLWGREKLLEALPPFLFGGSMVESVSDYDAIFYATPRKFEAGTPAIAEVIGLGAAIKYITSHEPARARRYEQSLCAYAGEKLTSTFGGKISFVGDTLGERVPLISFTLAGIHPHDAAQILAQNNICVRAGSHCALPAHRALGKEGNTSLRISFAPYNTYQEVDKIIEILIQAHQRLSL